MSEEIEKTVSFNILGACVSRDIFSRQPKYDIRQFVSFSSPMSMFLSPGERLLTEDDMNGVNGSAFSQRCLLLDHNKTGLTYLSNRSSDWLILDFADIRLPLIHYGNGQVLTETNLFLKNRAVFKKIFGSYTTEKMRSAEEYYACIDWLREEILKLYPPERIILHKYYMKEEYVNAKGELTPFKDQKYISNVNEVLQKLYAYFEQKCPDCFIIEMPDYILCAEKHIWGKYPMHYSKLYYEYGLQAVEHIIKTNTPVPETLRLQYSLKALELYRQAEQAKLVKERDTLAAERKKILCYAKTLRNLFADREQILAQMKEFCTARNIRHVALWGDFIISKALILALQEVGITTDYIICNWNNHTHEKVIRTTDSYPSTDAVIVCDVLYYERNAAFIAKRFDGQIYHINDFIPLVY